jgi:hypothetical protein
MFTRPQRLRGLKAATTGAPNRFVNGGAPARIAITNFPYPILADPKYNSRPQPDAIVSRAVPRRFLRVDFIRG